MLNAADVQEAIEGEDMHSEYGSPWYSDLEWDKRKPVTLNGVEYTAEFVDSYGGMDMGTELWVVFKIGDQLFKKYGAYYSHDGSYWDGSLDEVRPVQKTITVFE